MDVRKTSGTKSNTDILPQRYREKRREEKELGHRERESKRKDYIETDYRGWDKPIR